MLKLSLKGDANELCCSPGSKTTDVGRCCVAQAAVQGARGAARRGGDLPYGANFTREERTQLPGSFGRTEVTFGGGAGTGGTFGAASVAQTLSV